MLVVLLENINFADTPLTVLFEMIVLLEYIDLSFVGVKYLADSGLTGFEGFVKSSAALKPKLIIYTLHNFIMRSIADAAPWEKYSLLAK